MRWTSNELVLVGAAATIAVAVLSALAAYLATKRDRRRALYADAVQTIAGWNEMLYRVRRRTATDAPDLVTRFHELQDKLTYFCAWIGSESKYMTRSYNRLVMEVKDATEDLIQAAWDEPVRPSPAKALPNDIHPDISKFLNRFAQDCRSHLSPLPWRRIAVAWRNRDEGSS